MRNWTLNDVLDDLHDIVEIPLDKPLMTQDIDLLIERLTDVKTDIILDEMQEHAERMKSENT